LRSVRTLVNTSVFLCFTDVFNLDSEKRVKFDVDAILDNASMLKSTERWIASSDKDKEALTDRRDVMQEARSDARLASEFAAKPIDTDLKVALLDYKILSLERNLMVYQEWLATKYGPDGTPVKPGWVSVRSSANSGYRQSTELGDWAIGRKYEDATKPGVLSKETFAFKPREEWLAEARDKRAGNRK
jgi:hypothetical protein